MASFDQRVQKIVDTAIQHHEEMHVEGPDVPSRCRVDEIKDYLVSLFNLTADVKSEVNKIEHLIPSQQPQEKEDPEKEKKALEKVREWIKSQRDEWSDDVSDMLDWTEKASEIAKNLEPYVEGATRLTWSIISSILRTIFLASKLNDIQKDLNSTIKQVKETRSQLATCCGAMKERLTGLSDEVQQQAETTRTAVANVDSKVIQLSDDLTDDYNDIASRLVLMYEALGQVDQKSTNIQDSIRTCCQNMIDQFTATNDLVTQSAGQIVDIVTGIDGTTESTKVTVESIDHKVDLLDPVTNANNVLEILQRQKAIQASIDEIRRLL